MVNDGEVDAANGASVVGNFTNNGLFHIGEVGVVQGSDTVTITGDFTQTGQGVLAMDVSGGWDWLSVGTGHFGGTLALQSTDPIPYGMSYQLVGYGSRTGTFVINQPGMEAVCDDEHNVVIARWI